MYYNKFVVAQRNEQKRGFKKMNNTPQYAEYCSCRNVGCVGGGFSPDDQHDTIVLYPECVIRCKVPKNKRKLQKDVAAAGQKVFKLVLLNACEKQCEKISHLRDTLAELEIEKVATKRKLIFFTSLVCMEQNENDALTKEMERNIFECEQIRCACQRLTNSISNTKADIALIDQYLAAKNRDVASCKREVDEAMLEFYNTKAHNEELQAAMHVETRDVKYLEEQIDSLLNDIRDTANANRQLEIEYDKELDSKTDELEQATKYMRQLELNKKPLEECLQAAEENRKYVENLKREGQVLRHQIAFLQSQINKSLVCHCITHIKIFNPHAKMSLQVILELLKDILPTLMLREFVALLCMVH